MPTFKVILSDKAKRDGTYSVLLRVTLNRKNKKLSMGIFIPMKDFNSSGTYEKLNWIRTRNDDHDLYNKKIRNKIRIIQQKIAKAEEDGVVITLDLIKDLAGNKSQNRASFSEYYKKTIEKYDTPQHRSSHESYTASLAKLHQFTGRDVLFSDLSVSLFENFQTWLMTKYTVRGKSNTQNTASRTLSFFKTIIKLAIKDKLMKYEDNPFLHITLKREKANRSKLTKEEMKAFIDFEIPQKETAWHARNIFLMQYYLAGSRIGDMLTLKWEDIATGRSIFSMGKTGAKQNLKLHQKALDITFLYEANRTPGGFVFPFLDNTADYSDLDRLRYAIKAKTKNINRLLNKWIKRAGIHKRVSTHVARHTFTNVARRAGANLYDISKALRHSSLQVTEAYLEDFDDNAVDNVIDTVFDD